jgi:uncharacterized protein (DUF362 family)
MFSTIWSIDSYDATDLIDLAIGKCLDAHAFFKERNILDYKHVVIKPNWVQESHEYNPDEWESVITHPSVLYSTVNQVALRLRENASIIICDAPHTYANFERIVSRGNFVDRFLELSALYPLLQFELVDLRKEVWIRKQEVVVARLPNKPDPRGYVIFNLGVNSLFFKHPGEGRYYGADYDSDVVRSHHIGATQEYLMAGTPVRCDLFINIPKLKTHKKTGITCCLKNLVGINGDKNWLPHHTEGTPRSNGDEYPDPTLRSFLESRIKKLGKKIAINFPVVGPWMFAKMRNAGKMVLGDSEQTIRNGNWFGNDTCWRMALDLNRCLLYGNLDGAFRIGDAPKAFIGIIDGIKGGEGNGPICPKSVNSNVLITGHNPAELDAAASRVMGYDPKLIPIVRESFSRDSLFPISNMNLDDVLVQDSRIGSCVRLASLRPALNRPFAAHFGWKGNIEAF